MEGMQTGEAAGSSRICSRLNVSEDVHEGLEPSVAPAAPGGVARQLNRPFDEEAQAGAATALVPSLQAPAAMDAGRVAECAALLAAPTDENRVAPSDCVALVTDIDDTLGGLPEGSQEQFRDDLRVLRTNLVNRRAELVVEPTINLELLSARLHAPRPGAMVANAPAREPIDAQFCAVNIARLSNAIADAADLGLENTPRVLQMQMLRGSLSGRRDDLNGVVGASIMAGVALADQREQQSAVDVLMAVAAPALPQARERERAKKARKQEELRRRLINRVTHNLQGRFGNGLHNNMECRRFQRAVPSAMRQIMHGAKTAAEASVAALVAAMAAIGSPEPSNRDKYEAACEGWATACQAKATAGCGSGKSLAVTIAGVFSTPADQGLDPAIVGEYTASKFWTKQKRLYITSKVHDGEELGKEGLHPKFRVGGTGDASHTGLHTKVGLGVADVQQIASKVYRILDTSHFNNDEYKAADHVFCTCATCARLLEQGLIKPSDICWVFFDEADVSGQDTQNTDGQEESEARSPLSWDRIKRELCHALLFYFTGTPALWMEGLPDLVKCTYGDLYRDRHACQFHYQELVVEGLNINDQDHSINALAVALSRERPRIGSNLRMHEVAVKAYLRSLVKRVLLMHQQEGVPLQALILAPHEHRRTNPEQSIVQRIGTWLQEVIEEGWVNQFAPNEHSACWDRPLTVGTVGAGDASEAVLDAFKGGGVDILVGAKIPQRALDDAFCCLVLNLNLHARLAPGAGQLGGRPVSMRDQIKARKSENAFGQGISRGSRIITEEHARGDRERFATAIAAYVARFTPSASNPNPPRQPCFIWELKSNNNLPVMRNWLRRQDAEDTMVVVLDVLSVHANPAGPDGGAVNIDQDGNALVNIDQDDDAMSVESDDEAGSGEESAESSDSDDEEDSGEEGGDSEEEDSEDSEDEEEEEEEEEETTAPQRRRGLNGESRAAPRRGTREERRAQDAGERERQRQLTDERQRNEARQRLERASHRAARTGAPMVAFVSTPLQVEAVLSLDQRTRQLRLLLPRVQYESGPEAPPPEPEYALVVSTDHHRLRDGDPAVFYDTVVRQHLVPPASAGAPFEVMLTVRADCKWIALRATLVASAGGGESRYTPGFRLDARTMQQFELVWARLEGQDRTNGVQPNAGVPTAVAALPSAPVPPVPPVPVVLPTGPQGEAWVPIQLALDIARQKCCSAVSALKRDSQANGGGTPTMSPFFVPLLHAAIGLGGSHSGGGNFLKLQEASAFAIVCGVLNITQLIARIRDAWLTHADTAFLRDAPAGVLWRAQLAAGRSQAEVDNGYVPAAPDDQEVVAIVNQGCFPTRSRGYFIGYYTQEGLLSVNALTWNAVQQAASAFIATVEAECGPIDAAPPLDPTGAEGGETCVICFEMHPSAVPRCRHNRCRTVVCDTCAIDPTGLNGRCPICDRGRGFGPPAPSPAHFPMPTFMVQPPGVVHRGPPRAGMPPSSGPATVPPALVRRPTTAPPRRAPRYMGGFLAIPAGNPTAIAMGDNTLYAEGRIVDMSADGRVRLSAQPEILQSVQRGVDSFGRPIQRRGGQQVAEAQVITLTGSAAASRYEVGVADRAAIVAAFPTSFPGTADDTPGQQLTAAMDALEHACSTAGGGTLPADEAPVVPQRTLLGLNFLVRANAIHPDTWPLIPAGNPTIRESIAFYRELLRAGTMGPGTIGRFETLIVDQGWLTAPARRATGTSARSGSSGGRIGRIYWAWGRYLQMHGTQQQADAQSDGEE